MPALPGSSTPLAFDGNGKQRARSGGGKVKGVSTRAAGDLPRPKASSSKRDPELLQIDLRRKQLVLQRAAETRRKQVRLLPSPLLDPR